MSEDVRASFAAGSGDELGTAERPGKMFSLRSSSALSFSFFAPWIGRDLRDLAAVMGCAISDNTLRFERKFAHGLSSAPPHLDVTLDNEQRRPLGIECKFTEPYGPKQSAAPMERKYFAGGRLRWQQLGLPRCQTLAIELGRSVEFSRLDARQLLKHLLGLAWSTQAPPRLIYVWFDTKCHEADEHSSEIARFSKSIDGAVEFRALSYQTVFDQLRLKAEPVPGYCEYLSTRYFR